VPRHVRAPGAAELLDQAPGVVFLPCHNFDQFVVSYETTTGAPARLQNPPDERNAASSSTPALYPGIPAARSRHR